MSPPKKKRKTAMTKKQSPTPELYSISSFPDDLVLSCLARVSRLHYPTLSLVSKKFRSLVASPELYKVRSALGCAESCLYVSLEVYPDFDSRWFTLCQRPNTTTKTKTKSKKQKKPIGDLLVPVPFPDSPQPYWSTVVAVGSDIYFIGGYIDNAPSSNVSFLDCRSHTWHQAPNMQEAKKSRGVNVVDGKIYVLGRPVNKGSSWVEVFDPKTRAWNSVSVPGGVICKGELTSGSVEIDGKICMYGGGEGVAYNPKDGSCESIDWEMCRSWVAEPHCVVVVEKVLFYYDAKVFKWYDAKASLWRNVKGLEGMKHKIAKYSKVGLADYGGKIAVLWDKKFAARGCEEKMIWFAEISFERRRNDDEEEEDEIWGRVEFVDCVLTVPKSYNRLKVISATL